MEGCGRGGSAADFLMSCDLSLAKVLDTTRGPFFFGGCLLVFWCFYHFHALRSSGSVVLLCCLIVCLLFTG